jgi:hypothetical protein
MFPPEAHSLAQFFNQRPGCLGKFQLPALFGLGKAESPVSPFQQQVYHESHLIRSSSPIWVPKMNRLVMTHLLPRAMIHRDLPGYGNRSKTHHFCTFTANWLGIMDLHTPSVSQNHQFGFGQRGSCDLSPGSASQPSKSLKTPKNLLLPLAALS